MTDMTVRPHSTQPGTLVVEQGRAPVGVPFPASSSDPDGRWFTRRPGLRARSHPTRHAALANLLGCCPDTNGCTNRPACPKESWC